MPRIASVTNYNKPFVVMIAAKVIMPMRVVTLITNFHSSSIKR